MIAFNKKTRFFIQKVNVINKFLQKKVIKT